MTQDFDSIVASAGNWCECGLPRSVCHCEQATQTETDCRDECGITVGLIDSILTSARVLRGRDVSDAAVKEALKDLASDEDVAWLIACAKEEAKYLICSGCGKAQKRSPTCSECGESFPDDAWEYWNE